MPAILLLLALVFIILGVVFIVLGVRNNRLARAAASWPTAAGRVTSAALKRRVSMGADNDLDHHDTFEPVVEYAFEVNGQTYTGRRLSTGGTASYDRRRAQQILDRFPIGGAVQVRYDPANPSNCALEVKSGGGTVLLVMGIVFLVLALLGGCAGLLALA